jgi:hypothetical protein
MAFVNEVLHEETCAKPNAVVFDELDHLANGSTLGVTWHCLAGLDVFFANQDFKSML